MNARSIPHAPGVYKIRCEPNGKVYIGSTNDLLRRWREHRKMLRATTHPNPHLQAAWNKYGETCFIFEVVEVVDGAETVDREQYWIDSLQCCDRRVGFNLSPSAKHNTGYRHTDSAKQAMAVGHTKTWQGFIDPAGNVVDIYDLQRFCQENTLSYTVMTALAYGKPFTLQHKGWRHINAKTPRQKYKDLRGFIRPDGTPEPAPESVRSFCEQYGLSWKSVYKLINGKYKTHKGWRYVSYE
jgi:group I intron endonuclease